MSDEESSCGEQTAGDPTPENRTLRDNLKSALEDMESLRRPLLRDADAPAAFAGELRIAAGYYSVAKTPLGLAADTAAKNANCLSDTLDELEGIIDAVAEWKGESPRYEKPQ